MKLFGRLHIEFVGIGLGYLAINLINNMVAMAYPKLMKTFHIDYNTLMWLNVSYVVVFTVSMPVTGALSDRLGHRRSYVIGLAGLAMATLAEAAAWNFGSFMVFGTVEALSAGFMIPAQLSILHTRYPDKLSTAFTYISTAGFFAAIGGPFLAGLLLQTFGWRSMFLIACGMATATFTYFMFAIQRAEEPPKEHSAFDYRGAVIFIVAFLLLQIGIKVMVASRVDALTSGILLASLLLFGLLVSLERQTPEAFLPTELLSNNAYWITCFVATLTMTVTQGFIYSVPSYLQLGVGFSPVVAGGILTVEAIVGLLFTWTVRKKIFDAWGWDIALQLGILVSIFGIGSLIAIHSHNELLFAGIIALFEIGQTLIGPSLNAQVKNWVPEPLRGKANGFYSTIRYSGGAFAASVSGPLLRRLGRPGSAQQSRFEYARFLEILAALLVLALVIAAIKTVTKTDKRLTTSKGV